MTPLLSSHSLAWPGIVAERWALPAGDLRRLDEAHRASIHLGPPHRLREQRGGRTADGRHDPGDVVVVAAGDASRVRWDCDTSFFTVRVSDDLVRQASQSTDGALAASVQSSFSARRPELEGILRALMRALELEEPATSLSVQSLRLELAIALLGPGAPDKPRHLLPRHALDRVIDRLNAQVFERDTPLSLEALAGEAGLSPWHFARQFERSTGLPPHRYLLRARVEAAKNLLLAGMPASEAALTVGFSSQSHLGRHLRRIAGVTPGELRRRAAR